ncbi:MAG TPA: efflux RND transporter periplasmic adaptor subunit [Woeseiaceae bacterium]|nr:efflux RND transporter periplasmic adaptor subunit [Woeseiaceae bacterium]
MRTRVVFLIVGVLSAISAGVLAGVGGDAADPVAAPLPPEVTVSEVLIQEVHEWDEFTGRLESSETVEVRPRVSGYIESVHFDEGARIAKGDLLFQIDARPFRAEVNRLTAERDRALAQLELARTNSRRAERLFQQNATSREQLDSFTTAEATAAANVAAVEAQLDAAKLDLEFTRVVSPIDGRVSRALITPGNLVDSSSWLTTVVSPNPIYAYFDADEQTYLAYAGIARSDSDGETANKAFVGLINEQGHPHEGRLDFVDNRVDAESGTIRGRAVLDNSDDTLTPGLFARVKLVGRDTREVALIDDRAIGTDLDRKFVLVLDENNIAQYRAVTIGRLVDGLRIVTEGLAGGDVVIVNGLQRVRPGMPVTAQEVSMADLARPSLRQVTAIADSNPVSLASKN